jgi:hypothetical protein
MKRIIGSYRNFHYESRRTFSCYKKLNRYQGRKIFINKRHSRLQKMKTVSIL